jgi:hypothetical protein
VVRARELAERKHKLEVELAAFRASNAPLVPHVLTDDMPF